MKYEEFVRLEKGDLVIVLLDMAEIEGEIMAISKKKGRACVSLEPGSGESYRAVFVKPGMMERRRDKGWKCERDQKDQKDKRD